MKRYSFTAEAGVPIEFDHPGRFFTLLNCITPIDVSLQRGGAQPEVLEAVTPGIWADFGETPFTRIRVLSPVAQSVSFLVSMVQSGWKTPPSSIETTTTDITALAASAVSNSPWIDLGYDWASAVVCAQFYGGVSAGSLFIVQCSPDTLTDMRVAVGQGWNGGAVLSTGAAATGHLSSLRPVSRFVRSQFTNGSAIQPSGRHVLNVFKNVTA